MKLRILASGVQGICEPMDPEEMAAFHPAWRPVYHAGAPWRKTSGRGGRLWFNGSGGKTKAGEATLVLCGPCSSTMEVGRWLYRQGFSKGDTAVSAVSQWAGRGRKNSPWQSPPGNLYTTWILPPMAEAQTRLLPLLVCLGIARELESRGLEPKVKWPNDILVWGRKVGGVLLEDTGRMLLAGIGVNLNHSPPESCLKMDGAVPAAHLAQGDAVPGLLSLWEGIYKGCRRLFGELENPAGRREIVLQAEARLAWLGEAVAVRSHEGEDHPAGIVMGLAEDGALKLARGIFGMQITSAHSISPVPSASGPVKV